MRTKLLQSCLTLCNPMDCSLPGSSLSLEFPRQEYWSGLPFPPPGELPDPGIQATSPELAGGFFTTEPPRKPMGLHVPNEWTHLWNCRFHEDAPFQNTRLLQLISGQCGVVKCPPAIVPRSSVSTAKTADAEAVRSFLVHFLSLPSSLTGPTGKLTLLGTWEPVLSSEESWVLEN